VALNTRTAFVNPDRMRATVDVTVLDNNDNRPEFRYTADYNRLVPASYLATVQEVTGPGEELLRVNATDADSGNLGRVRYEIAPETDGVARDYFSIDEETGVVRTERGFQEVPEEALPFRLVITARDNPGKIAESKMEKTELVVNLIKKENLMVLVIRNRPPEVVKRKKEGLMNILQEQGEANGLVMGIYQIVSSQERLVNNTCCRLNTNSTDVWFYAIDKQSLAILPYDNTITEDRAQTSLKYTITGAGLELQASEIRRPYPNAPVTTAAPTPSVKAVDTPWSGYPAALIAFGCLIFALSLAAIIYLLVLYAKYKTHKERSQRMVIIPRYEPVFVEPHLKEYETQVLQMSVALDDIDSNDLKLDFSSRNHVFDPGFNLDSVSYITHEPTSSESPTSETATHTTFRASSGAPSSLDTDLGHHRQHYMDMEQQKSSDSEDGLDDRLNMSLTNDNVMFREKKEFNTSPPTVPREKNSFGVSPIDATTQL